MGSEPTPDTYDPNRDGRLYSSPEASRFLKAEFNLSRHPSRLADMRLAGGGPEFIKVGRTVLYPERALREWALSKLRRPLLRVLPAGPDRHGREAA